MLDFWNNSSALKQWGIILGLGVLLFLISGQNPMGFLLSIPGVILAITVHESGHALCAYMLGDRTSEARISLNPFKHVDPVGLLMLAFVHVGWGKPVVINPNNFRTRMSPQVASALVSMSGPFANFLFAFLMTIITVLLANFFALPAALLLVLQLIITINIGIGVFNLIPIPPLDGYSVLELILPERVRYLVAVNINYITLIFLLLIIVMPFSWVGNVTGTVYQWFLQLTSILLSPFGIMM